MSDNYNGWSNYETWCAKLWLDNDEGLQLHMEEQAQKFLNDHQGDKDDAERDLARYLEDQCDEMAPSLPNSMFSDLMTMALGRIDWREIATNVLEDVEYEGEEA